MKMLTEAEHTALVARVERHTGSLGDMAIIVWLRQQPPEGTPLYTHPDPRVAELKGLLQRVLDEAMVFLTAELKADIRKALREGKS